MLLGPRLIHVLSISKAFPIFLHSTASVYYTEHKQKHKKWRREEAKQQTRAQKLYTVLSVASQEYY